MAGRCRRLPTGRCRESHKDAVYQCSLVTDQIQDDFNAQYWACSKKDQDQCLLSSIKAASRQHPKTDLDYKYFIFGYQVCSQMFVRTLGYQGRSRIEYLFRSLKKANSLNSLMPPIDGRKNNRVQSSRTHDEAFLRDLHQFVDSFRTKNSSRPVIHDHRPIDLYRIFCERSGYELIYENKNIKIRRKANTEQPETVELAGQPAIEDQPNQLNTDRQTAQFGQLLVQPDQQPNLSAIIEQSNVTITGEYYEDSMNLTNGPILYINEVSNEISSEVSNQQFATVSNQTLPNQNNFNLFNQTISRCGGVDQVGQANLFCQIVGGQVSQVGTNRIDCQQTNSILLSHQPVCQTVQSNSMSNQINNSMNNPMDSRFAGRNTAQNSDHSAQLEQRPCQTKSDNMLSFSAFLRFLKKHHFEFK